MKPGHCNLGRTLGYLGKHAKETQSQDFKHPQASASLAAQYLGHTVSREGTLSDPDNVKAIMQCATPKSLTELRSFNGMVQYYGNYMLHWAQIAAPLHRLYRNGVQFTWSSDCQQASEEIKGMLVSPAVLRRADPELPYILQMDWSPTANGAILAQEDASGEKHPVAYASKMVKGPELKYSATSK